MATSGLGAYRPGERRCRHHRLGARSTASGAAASPAGHWTWDGGAPVTVGHGETLDAIAPQYGVPASAMMQTNGITNPAAIRPGQRLVIPRYVSGSRAARRGRGAARRSRSVRRRATSTSSRRAKRLIGDRAPPSTFRSPTLARANNIQPYTKLNIGDRLTIPGGARRVSGTGAPAPRVAQPRTVAAQTVASIADAERAHCQGRSARDREASPRAPSRPAPLPSFRWPVQGRIIAGFGPQPNGTQNDGINLAVPEGTPIKAADDGVVAYAGNELKGYGNLVLIRHANGYVSAYANASELLVKRGDSVKRGQVIAHAGQTGNVTSPQLHFEIRKGSTPVDPTKYLSGA